MARGGKTPGLEKRETWGTRIFASKGNNQQEVGTNPQPTTDN